MPKAMFALFDECARVWNEPFCDFTEDSARRSFGEFVRSNAAKNPAIRDYTLYCIGSFRDGSVTPCDRFVVAHALDFLGAEHE